MRRATITAAILIPTILSTARAQTLVNDAVVEQRNRRQSSAAVAASVTPAIAGFDTLPSSAIARLWASAARFARDHEGEFDAALRLQAEFPATFLRESRDTATAAHAAAIALISDDETTMARVLGKVAPADTILFLQDARALRRALQLSGVRSGSAITLFADGNIRGAASGGPDEEGPVGTGSIGLALTKGRQKWAALVAVASTQDTISSGFGSTILSPASGSSLFSGLVDLRTPMAFRVPVIGWDVSHPIHLYATSAKSTWRMNDSTVRDAVAFGAGTLLTWDILDDYVGDNYIGFRLEAGAAMRWVTGDVASRENEAARLDALETSRRFFGGFEAGMQISFGRVTGGTQVYWLHNLAHRREHVRGLTHGQLVAGLSVAGDLFRGQIGR